MSSLSDEVRSLCKRGLRLAEAGEMLEAEAIFLLLIEQYPRESFFYCLLGNLYMDNQLPQLAIGRFKQAIELSQNCIPGWGGLGRAYAELEQWTVAEAAFRTRLALEPNPNYYIYLANVLLHTTKYEEVLTCCASAIEMDNKNPDAYITTSSALCFLGRYSQAFKYSKKAVAMDANYAEALVSLANVFCHLKRFDEASDAFQTAINIDPDFAPAYLEFGCLQYSRGDLGLAESYIRSSLELDDSCLKAHFYLALVFRSSGRYCEARLEMRRCRALRECQRMA